MGLVHIQNKRATHTIFGRRATLTIFFFGLEQSLCTNTTAVLKTEKGERKKRDKAIANGPRPKCGATPQALLSDF